MAGSYDRGNGLSSFINNGVYSLSNGVVHQLFITSRKPVIQLGIGFCTIFSFNFISI